MATSYLIGKVEISIYKRIDGCYAIAYHPYERPVWIDRLERNIVTINGYGVQLARVFDTQTDAENHIKNIVESIAKDYSVPITIGSPEFVRDTLLRRLAK